MCGIVICPSDDHYRPTNATWARDLCTCTGCLMAKFEKSDKVSYDMTQILRILTIATVFTGSSILIAMFLTRMGGGAYSQVKNTSARTLAENRRGAYTRRGHISGILWYMQLIIAALSTA